MPAVPHATTHPVTITIALPAEFVALCRARQVEPGTVLCGFIADVCALHLPESGYFCNGWLPHLLARGYLASIGYERWSR